MTKIFCDYDGVLVNFLGGCRMILGRPWDSFKTPEDKAQRTKVTFQSPTFWKNLPPLEDFHYLWNFIRKYDTSILTAYPHRISDQVDDEIQEIAKKGKWEWNTIHTKVHRSQFHCVAREHKQLYATYVGYGDGKPEVISNVLIDDHEQNIKEWRANRGIGILHVDAKSTVEQLKELGFV